jgi:hypothetical protein
MTISELLPGHFGEACASTWGTVSEFHQLDLGLSSEASAADIADVDAVSNAATTGERNMEVTQPNADATSFGWPGSTAAPVSGDNAADNAWPTASTDGWGGGGGWGSATEDGGWPSTNNPWQHQDADSGWGDAKQVTLDELPGAKTLSRTHMRGIVEKSTRKIVQVVKPNASIVPKPEKEISTPEEAEAELDRRFAKLIMSPWGWWDDRVESDIRYPYILKQSQGAVVVNGEVTGGEVTVGAKPFHPCEDTVTVLIPKEGSENMLPGMGVGAIFLQIVRKDGTSSGFWYVEQVSTTLPSFYWLDECDG